MRDGYFAFLLFLSFLFFIGSSIILGIASYLFYNDAQIVGCFFVIIFFTCILYEQILFATYNESNLMIGKTKEIYKEKKKLKKLKIKKEHLIEKNKNLKEFQSLKCEIKALELEMNNQLTICSKCGSMNQMEGCFCSKCGNNLKSK